LSFIAVKIISRFVIKYFIEFTKRKSSKEQSEFDAVFFKSIKRQLIPIAYIIAFYLSTKLLNLNAGLSTFLEAIVLAITMILGAVFISTLAIYILSKYWKKSSDAKNDVLLIWISAVIKAIVWIIALLLFLDNMDVKITGLLAGVGVGGIAIAFAAQAVLADIFCFFSILSDRPFEIGDFIVVDNYWGTVEHIGLKTTRLRALSGEQLVFSNTDLTSSRVQNYKTMKHRRMDFTLGVTYDTSYEKLKIIPDLIEESVREVKDTRYYRTHFTKYGAFSLDFEIAYYILSADYDKFLDVHQQVNLLIKKRFDQEGIEFAFPTQTLYLPGMSPELK
ncbi:unnamed protein product, partial [marine sediment metagenome]